MCSSELAGPRGSSTASDESDSSAPAGSRGAPGGDPESVIVSPGLLGETADSGAGAGTVPDAPRVSSHHREQGSASLQAKPDENKQKKL